MSLLVEVARASLRSEPLCHTGASSGTLGSGSSSSQPSTIHPCCLNTRRAVTAMCMIISRYHVITETSWPAPSTIAPGPP
uniref:Uncharacterized protein n=1 Tax=Arundo donax TaxID=35708 RepID=A0A0A8ZKB5_ARUDO